MSPLEQQQAAQLAAQQSQLLQQQQAIEQAQAHIAHLQQQAASASSSSSSSSSSPLASSSSESSVASASLSPHRPSPFLGSIGSDAEHWLIELERYFLASGTRSPLDSSSVLFASTYLRESASMWFSAKYKGMSQLPDTWKQFREDFLLRFRPFAAARTARASLRSLTQLKEGGISAYSDSFLRLIQLLPEMHVQDQLDAYLHGLQPQLAEVVDRAEPKTLEAAINMAQREEIRNRDRTWGTEPESNPLEVQPTSEEPSRFGVANRRLHRTHWREEVRSPVFSETPSFPTDSSSPDSHSESIGFPSTSTSTFSHYPSQSSVDDSPADMDLSKIEYGLSSLGARFASEQ